MGKILLVNTQPFTKEKKLDCVINNKIIREEHDLLILAFLYINILLHTNNMKEQHLSVPCMAVQCIAPMTRQAIKILSSSTYSF